MRGLRTQIALTFGLGFALATEIGSAQSSATDERVKLEEIVVTAERRTSDIQATAASVSVRQGDELRREGKFSLREVLEDVAGASAVDVPGGQMFSGGSDSQGTGVTIRGLSSNSSPTALSAVPATAIYTDGVYEGVGGRFDIDRIEVLRGPQGTLYGRSATAGVLAIHTRNPILNEYGGDVAVEAGNYDLRHYSGAVNLPAGETVAFRVAADRYERDGFYAREGGALSRTAARAKLLFQPNENLSMLFGASLEENRVHTGGLTGSLIAPDSVVYSAVPVRLSENGFRQYWADIDWNFGPATLTYEPALRTWDQDANFYASGPAGGALKQVVKSPFDQFVTHELRLTSAAESRVSWLVGSFFYDNRLRNTNDIRWDASAGLLANVASRRETEALGFFAESTVPFLETWRLTAGLRYDETRVATEQDYTTNNNFACFTPVAGVPTGPTTFLCPLGPAAFAPGFGPNAGLPEDNVTLSVKGDEGERNFYNLTYKVRLETDLTPVNLAYAMISSGFVPGDVQVATGRVNGIQAPVATTYDEETLTAYEIGTKNRFRDERLQVNASLYYYRYGGFQRTIIVNELDPSSAIRVTVPARVKGGELEMLYRLTRNDRFSVSYGYTDAYYVDPLPPEFTATVAKKEVADVVPHTVNAGYDHMFDLAGGSTLNLHADARFLSARDVINISPTQLAQGGEVYVRADDQVIGNVSVGWTSSEGRYAVTGFVRNVTDERYVTGLQLQSLTPLLTTTVAQSDPRTYGVMLSARF